MVWKTRVFALVLIVVGTSLPSIPVLGQDILIGAGTREGTSFAVARAICRLVDREGGIPCEALETEGALFNLDNVRGGALELGIVPSDLHYNAVKKAGPFTYVDLAYDDLRSLFSLHAEPFVVMVRKDSGIRTLDDLKGRRVNLGDPGSPQRAMMDLVMAVKGWSPDDFRLAEELPRSQQTLTLCHNRVEAAVTAVAHPDESVAKAIILCRALLVGPDDTVVDRLTAAHPYLVPTTLPTGLYPAAPAPVSTLGVRLTVIGSTNTDDDTIYAIVKAVFDNLGRFMRMHRAFLDMNADTMLRQGLTAPMHDGAERYFRETGLM